VLAARKTLTLGSLNPAPFVSIFLNCVLWASYGLMKHDIYLFLSNSQGVVLGCFFTLTALQLADAAGRRLLERAFVACMALLLLIALLAGFAAASRSTAEKIVGACCTLAALAFYAAPLSTLAEVVRTKNAASLSLPLCLASLANAALWSVYGAAMSDPAILVPNLPGILCAALQLVLIQRFKDSTPPAAESGLEMAAKCSDDEAAPGSARPDGFLSLSEEGGAGSAGRVLVGGARDAAVHLRAPTPDRGHGE
jgi:solute carrier family 50 protein (sugar transporter)